MSVKCAVVIPVYNRPLFVEQAISSVLEQTAQAAQVIVIDDGSSDDNRLRLVNFVRNISAVYPIQLIYQNNRGAAAARNFGVAHLGSEIDFVCFLDSDDIWPKDFVARVAQRVKSRANVVAVSVNAESWDIDANQKVDMRIADFIANPLNYMISRGAGIGSCSTFRLSAVRDAGGFPEDRKTGHDMCLYGALSTKGSWLYDEGLPVVFRRNFKTKNPSEVPHLFLSRSDFRLQWALSAEQCASYWSRDERSQPEIRWLLAQRWLAAAVQEIEQKRYSSGAVCLIKALKRNRLVLNRSTILSILRALRRSAKSSPRRVS